MKIPSFIFIILVSLSPCVFSQDSTSTVILLSPGINISKLSTDSAGMKNVANPLIGISISKNISASFSINGGIDYTFTGAIHNSPRYNFKNSYVDFVVFPQYEIKDFLKFQIGGQYSYLLKSQLIIPNYMSADKTKKITLNGKYSNQVNLFVSAGLHLQKNVSLNFRYCIPLKSNEFKSFQISLDIILKKEYFKRKDSITKMDLNGIEYQFPNTSYIEKDGIIYPSGVTSPPVFRDGLASINQYFEDNIRVFPRDYKYFGNTGFKILFKINMDTLGNITASNLEEMYSESQGTGSQGGYLQDEIKKAIDSMPLWKPAQIDGKPVDLTFYLPFCFMMNENKIVMLPSKYQFIFHNRKN